VGTCPEDPRRLRGDAEGEEEGESMTNWSVLLRDAAIFAAKMYCGIRLVVTVGGILIVKDNRLGTAVLIWWSELERSPKPGELLKNGILSVVEDLKKETTL
jgi:hypothetical protein